MGCAILPHLKDLVNCIGGNLNDEQAEVRTLVEIRTFMIPYIDYTQCRFGLVIPMISTNKRRLSVGIPFSLGTVIDAKSPSLKIHEVIGSINSATHFGHKIVKLSYLFNKLDNMIPKIE